MAVAAVADQVHHHVAVEFVTVLHRPARDAHGGVRILGIHVEDRDGQTLGHVGSEARRRRVLGIGGKSNQVVHHHVHRASHGVAVQVGQIERFRRRPLARKSRVAMQQQGQDAGGTSPAKARLLGARATHRYGVHRFQVGGIRDHVNLHDRAVGRHVIAGGSQVILHIAAAQEAARVNVLEAREDILRRLAHDVDHHVQPAAMAHGQHHLLGAQLRRAHPELHPSPESK